MSWSGSGEDLVWPTSYNTSDNESEQDNNRSCFSLDAAPVALQAWHATVLSIIILCSLLGNVLVLVLVVAYKKLKTRSVIISMSLVVADILFTLTYTLPALVTTVSKEWMFGDNGCIAFGFLASTLLTTRWFILSLLCLDRFCTIFFPFSYNKRGKRGIIMNIIFISITWLVPFVLSIIPVHIFVEFELRENNPTCLPTCDSQTCRIYYFFTITITYIIGTILPIILYSCLFHKARQHKKSAKLKMGHYTIRVASGALVTQPIAEVPKTNPREYQATVTFLLLFVTVAITATPSYLLQLLRAISSDLHCAISLFVHFISFEILLSASVLTPLVIMKDKNFRACLHHLFRCGRKTGDMISSGQERRGSTSIEQRSFASVSQSRRSSIAAPCAQDSSKPQSNGTLELAVYTITELCESESNSTSAPS